MLVITGKAGEVLRTIRLSGTAASTAPSGVTDMHYGDGGEISSTVGNSLYLAVAVGRGTD